MDQQTVVDDRDHFDEAACLRIFCNPCSCRFVDLIPQEYDNNVWDAQRMTIFPRADAYQMMEWQVASLATPAMQTGVPMMPFAAKQRQALRRRAGLVHGGNPISREPTGSSIVTRYASAI